MADIDRLHALETEYTVALLYGSQAKLKEQNGS